MAADILFSDLGIGANDVVVTYNAIFYLCSRLDAVPISYLGVVHVGLYAKYIVTTDTHYIVFLCWLEHNNRSFFNDVVIPKDYFEVFLFFFTDDWTGWIDYAPFAKSDIADNLIKP